MNFYRYMTVITLSLLSVLFVFSGLTYAQTNQEQLRNQRFKEHKGPSYLTIGTGTLVVPEGKIYFETDKFVYAKRDAHILGGLGLFGIQKSVAAKKAVGGRIVDAQETYQGYDLPALFVLYLETAHMTDENMRQFSNNLSIHIAKMARCRLNGKPNYDDVTHSTTFEMYMNENLSDVGERKWNVWGKIQFGAKGVLITILRAHANAPRELISSGHNTLSYVEFSPGQMYEDYKLEPTPPLPSPISRLFIIILGGILTFVALAFYYLMQPRSNIRGEDSHQFSERRREAAQKRRLMALDDYDEEEGTRSASFRNISESSRQLSRNRRSRNRWED